jgi:hypothetical protein
MALISEWMEQCGKKVLDNAGIVREACLPATIQWPYSSLMIAKKVWWTLALTFAGFLVGTYVATGRETSVVRGLLLCPPAILMALVPTDPHQSDIWMLVAPLNACLYACLCLTFGSFQKETD